MRLPGVGPCSLVAILGLLFGACETLPPSGADTPMQQGTPATLDKSAPAVTESAPPPGCVRMLGALNTALKDQGKKYRVMMMEYITAPGSGQFGSTVFAKDVGNKQLAYHYVPALLAYPGLFTYVVDRTEGNATGGLTNADTEPAIDRAMATWDNVIGSGLSITKIPSSGADLGYVQWILGLGGAPYIVADVTHAGWLPGLFFDAISPPNGSSSILGVTFTFIWIDGAGNPVDTNGDGKFDAAFREIYYNNAFAWTTESVDWTSPLVDVETIALHESGHGLSQAHFGMIFNDGKGTAEPGFQVNHLHFSPRAVMNAVYWDTQRTLLGTDVAGHRSIWQTWPAK
jgi:hypothetical protein